MGLFEIAGAVPDQGSLTKFSPLELLGWIFSRRKTGKLVLSPGRAETTVFLFNGIPVNVIGGQAEALLEAMIRDQRLTGEDALQVRQFAKEKGRDPLTAIRALFDFTESQIYYFQEQAVKETVIKTCGFTQGAYRLIESEDLLKDVVMYDLNPLEIIYQGIVRYHGSDLAPQIQQIESRVVKLNPGLREFFLLPEPLYQHSDLLDVFGREIKIQDAFAVLNRELADVNQTIRLLYLLLITGVIELTPEIPADEIFEDSLGADDLAGAAAGARDDLDHAAADQPGAPEADTSYVITSHRVRKAKKPKEETIAHPASSARRQVIMSESIRPAEPSKAPAAAVAKKPEKKAPPPIPDPPKADPHLALRERLLAFERRLTDAVNLYEVLEVSVGDGLAELQEAYARGRDGLLPAEAGDPPEDLRALAERLRREWEDAYATLADAGRRFEYEMKLFEEEKRRMWDLGLKKTLARKMAERGAWYLRYNAPGHAEDCYRAALDLDPGEGRYYLELGWSLFRSRGDRADEAVSYLHTALKADSKLDQAHYYLGIIYKREGHELEADREFRAALELNPGHPSARRELSYLTQHQKQEGLLTRLFGKK